MSYKAILQTDWRSVLAQAQTRRATVSKPATLSGPHPLYSRRVSRQTEITHVKCRVCIKHSAHGVNTMIKTGFYELENSLVLS